MTNPPEDKQNYKIVVKDNDGIPRTFLVQGENEKRALNYAQRLAERKFGISRIAFHTNKISCDLANSGMAFKSK